MKEPLSIKDILLSHVSVLKHQASILLAGVVGNHVRFITPNLAVCNSLLKVQVSCDFSIHHALYNLHTYPSHPCPKSPWPSNGWMRVAQKLCFRIKQWWLSCMWNDKLLYSSLVLKVLQRHWLREMHATAPLTFWKSVHKLYFYWPNGVMLPSVPCMWRDKNVTDKLNYLPDIPSW